MALDKKVFKTRTLTAIVFAIVMLAGLFTNVWTFLILFSIIHFGCWFEFVKIIKLIFRKNYGTYLLLGFAYITLPILCMLHLGMYDAEMGFQSFDFHTAKGLSFLPILSIAVIFSIWINDTMAYVVGSLIGKTPFSPISPKKTWEGTIGGMILCVGVIALLGYFIPVAKTIAIQHWICIAVISAIAGTLGDLLESKLKRSAGIKDSGNFMPGHGGFLDRFDSLLIATPFVWLYVQFVMS